MPSPEEMAATMRANVEEKTGHPTTHWFGMLKAAGLQKHGEMVKHLKAQGVGHGFANLIVTDFRAETEGGTDADPVDLQYSGKKEHLRPIHDAVIEQVRGLGGDVEIAPKKAYVSLRRSKQFAQVGPPTNTQVEVGLNLKGHDTTDRLKSASGMVTHKVRLASVDKVDSELEAWLRTAYENG